MAVKKSFRLPKGAIYKTPDQYHNNTHIKECIYHEYDPEHLIEKQIVFSQHGALKIKKREIFLKKKYCIFWIKKINMKKIRFINLKFKNKLFKKKILNRFNRILHHGQFILGPEVLEMEKKIAKYCKRKFCVGTASGTDALYLAIRSLDISKEMK